MFKLPLHSQNHSLHSATNRLLRSENFSQWRKFNAFATRNSGFSEVDADEKFNYSLPSARVPEIDHIKSSASALNTKKIFTKNSFGGASQKGSAFISPEANEAFRTSISPRLKAPRVKDNSSAARHGSSHLRKYFGRKYYCAGNNEVVNSLQAVDPDILPRLLSDSQTSRGASYVNLRPLNSNIPLNLTARNLSRSTGNSAEVDRVCKIPGCGRKCSAMHLYPED